MAPFLKMFRATNYTSVPSFMLLRKSEHFTSNFAHFTWTNVNFKDLNIHLYLTLSYMASEDLEYSAQKTLCFKMFLCGLTVTQNSIHTISDLHRPCLTDT